MLGREYCSKYWLMVPKWVRCPNMVLKSNNASKSIGFWETYLRVDKLSFQVLFKFLDDRLIEFAGYPQENHGKFPKKECINEREESKNRKVKA
jgi:hypothetical protein